MATFLNEFKVPSSTFQIISNVQILHVTVCLNINFNNKKGPRGPEAYKKYKLHGVNFILSDNSSHNILILIYGIA